MNDDKNYKKELRANRHRYFDQRFKALLANSGLDPKFVSARILREIRNLQNRTRGDVFELLGEVLVQQQVGVDERPSRQARFFTPFGGRRIDLFFDQEGLAVEVKSGHITNRRSIRSQIRKDHYLLRAGLVRGILWVLFRGATSGTLRDLERHDIPWVDLLYDDEHGSSTAR